MKIKKKIAEKYRKDGIAYLILAILKQPVILTYTLFLGVYYRLKFGKASPNPTKVYHVKPEYLRESISTDEIPSVIKPFGLISGNWDKKGTEWRECFWKGLEERFVEGKDWKNTEYYETGTDRLEKEGKFGPLDGEQSIENFKDYLSELDSIFTDMEENGYRKSSVLTACVGRKGNYILTAGKHRRVMAELLEIDRVPVRVVHRHREWQGKRVRVLERNEKSEEHPDLDLQGEKLSLKKLFLYFFRKPLK